MPVPCFEDKPKTTQSRNDPDHPFAVASPGAKSSAETAGREHDPRPGIDVLAGGGGDDPPAEADHEHFLADYEARAATLLSRYNQSHHIDKPKITAHMFAAGAREVLRMYKSTRRVVPVEIAYAQLMMEGGLSGKERTQGNVFNVGETDAGGRYNHGHAIGYDEGFRAYYLLIARRYLDEKTPEQLLERGGFNNGKGTQGGAYAANPMYEGMLKAEIGRVFMADSGFKLSGSVGHGGDNRPADVKIVGDLLVRAGYLQPGDVGDVEKVSAAIAQFQQQAILPDENAGWYARRMTDIKGRGKEHLPDNDPALGGAARQSMRDINIQKRSCSGGLIRPGSPTLGVLFYSSKEGNKFDGASDEAGPPRLASAGAAAATAGAAAAQAAEHGTSGPATNQSAGGPADDGAVQGRLTVKERDLNVRSGPSLSAGKLGILRAGSSVWVTGQEGHWYRVQSTFGPGYVSGLPKYVDFHPALGGAIGTAAAAAMAGGAGGLAGAMADLAEGAAHAVTSLFSWLCETNQAGGGSDAGAGANAGTAAGATVGQTHGPTATGATTSASACAGAGHRPETQAGESYVIQSGELTATGEGSDAQTRYIHWPGTAASGVTLGKGYDIGSRTPGAVIADLTGAGMGQAQAEKISAGAQKKGAAAGAFVAAHKAEIGEIAKSVQVRLLATQLEVYRERAHHTATDQQADPQGRNAAAQEKKGHKPAGTFVMSEAEWGGLHPAMVEFLTDLIYQGGYYGWARVARINEALKAHAGDALGQFVAVRGLFADDDGDSFMDDYAEAIGEHRGKGGAHETLYGSDVQLGGKFRRNQVRVAYLDRVIAALSSGKNVTVSSGTEAVPGPGPGQGAGQTGRAVAAGGKAGSAAGTRAGEGAMSLGLRTGLDGSTAADGGAGAGWGLFDHYAGAAGAGAGALHGGQGRAESSLDGLLAQQRLTPDQIQHARSMIAQLPVAQQGHYYLLLQSKPEYQNQRDNKTKQEVGSGGTCNLTSVAMCLEYLGVPNPKPKLQYDEALCAVAAEHGWHDLTQHSTWSKVAKQLGVQMNVVREGGHQLGRPFWESDVRDKHLRAGHSVLCSITGHIVRVQAVAADGLVVDDPYGHEVLLPGTKHRFDARNRGKAQDSASGHAQNEGEDNVWPWQNVESHTFGWVYAFAC